MRSFPWDSIVEYMDDGYPVYDRAYSAREWWDIYSTFFSNGVFMDASEAFAVTAGNSMTVQVSPGRCNINGTFGAEDSARILEITAASSQDRIDTVVLRWDANVEARAIDLYVRQGVAAASPVRPTLTRSETVYELGLCDIFIPRQTTKIDQERITDTRAESARCGWVTPLVDIDTTTFYNQVNAALAEMKKTLDEETQKAVDMAQQAISGTLAGQLQNQITENKNSINSTKSDLASYESATEPRLSALESFLEAFLGDYVEVPITSVGTASGSFTMPRFTSGRMRVFAKRLVFFYWGFNAPSSNIAAGAYNQITGCFPSGLRLIDGGWAGGYTTAGMINAVGNIQVTFTRQHNTNANIQIYGFGVLTEPYEG